MNLAMADDDKQERGEQNALVKAESMVQLALAVPAGCVAGLLLGAWLDRHFHQHWMTVTLMLLGSIGGFIQIFTAAVRTSKEKE